VDDVAINQTSSLSYSNNYDTPACSIIAVINPTEVKDGYENNREQQNEDSDLAWILALIRK